jgi:hypothetical protein
MYMGDCLELIRGSGERGKERILRGEQEANTLHMHI